MDKNNPCALGLVMDFIQEHLNDEFVVRTYHRHIYIYIVGWYTGLTLYLTIENELTVLPSGECMPLSDPDCLDWLLHKLNQPRLS